MNADAAARFDEGGHRQRHRARADQCHVEMEPLDPLKKVIPKLKPGVECVLDPVERWALRRPKGDQGKVGQNPTLAPDLLPLPHLPFDRRHERVNDKHGFASESARPRMVEV